MRLLVGEGVSGRRIAAPTAADNALVRPSDIHGGRTARAIVSRAVFTAGHHETSPEGGLMKRVHSFTVAGFALLLIAGIALAQGDDKKASEKPAKASKATYLVEAPHTPEECLGLMDEVNKSRSEEHTSELQSLRHLVCRLLL